jgi:hypothetical protein
VIGDILIARIAHKNTKPKILTNHIQVPTNKNNNDNVEQHHSKSPPATTTPRVCFLRSPPLLASCGETGGYKWSLDSDTWNRRSRHCDSLCSSVRIR